MAGRGILILLVLLSGCADNSGVPAQTSAPPDGASQAPDVSTPGPGPTREPGEAPPAPREIHNATQAFAATGNSADVTFSVDAAAHRLALRVTLVAHASLTPTFLQAQPNENGAKVVFQPPSGDPIEQTVASIFPSSFPNQGQLLYDYGLAVAGPVPGAWSVHVSGLGHNVDVHEVATESFG